MNKPTTLRELKKYNSVWQVLNATNDLESKYKVIEALIDGFLTSHNTELVNKYENCPQCTGLRDEFKAELVSKIEGKREEAREHPMYNGYKQDLRYNDGYEQALDEVKKIINQNK